MNKNNHKSTLLSIALHVLILICALNFKPTNILVPSRSDGMEVSLVTQADIAPARVIEVKQEPLKVENVDNADIKMKQPDITPAPPKPLVKPKIVKVIKKSAKNVTQINDLINDLTPSQHAGNSRGSAAGGSNLGTSNNNNLVTNYADLIINKIRPLVLIPDEIDPNAKAIVQVTLLPNMKVYQVILIKSSGNINYDNNILQAVNRANTFPPLPDGANFSDFRKLKLTFRPN
ncbi:MAG: TonB family protein [Burkholderiales bacterium]|nr:TonB family protein [Burkholderiales bacterium]